jgi:hypothetical protein
MPHDPKTGLRAPDRFDPDVGMPIDPYTNCPVPLDDSKKTPYNPYTCDEMPGKFDPVTG